MMMLYLYSVVFFFLSGLFVYILKYNHFLLMLLSLESMTLSLFIMMFIYYIQFMNEYFLSMFFLSMSVCEGALGLSLLVLVIRVHSSDKILMFDNLW